MGKPWVYGGRLRECSKLRAGTHSTRNIQYGVEYNAGKWGAIHTVEVSSWNVGTRITVADSYLQSNGDEDSSEDGDYLFGTTVFHKGIRESEDPDNWYQQYFYLYNDGVAHDTNSIANDVGFMCVTLLTRSPVTRTIMERYGQRSVRRVKVEA